jgi:hypothetical protein
MKSRILACAVLLVLGLPAGAQESKCTAAKHQAAGAYARALEACRAKALKKGVPADPACDARARAALVKQFEKAEKKADCIVTAEEGLAASAARNFVDDVHATVQRGSGVCCDLAGAACGWVTDPADCATLGGTAGAPNTVCDGGGGCTAEPTGGGACCENGNSTPPEPTCAIPSDLATCTAGGGDAFVFPALCATSRCIRFEGVPPK